jgi:hypothetical protein
MSHGTVVHMYQYVKTCRQWTSAVDGADRDAVFQDGVHERSLCVEVIVVPLLVNKSRT